MPESSFKLNLFQFAPEAGPTISLPNIIREGCQEDAYDMVNKNNNVDEKVCCLFKRLDSCYRVTFLCWCLVKPACQRNGRAE